VSETEGEVEALFDLNFEAIIYDRMNKKKAGYKSKKYFM